jgi:hypothetical protein
VISTALSQPAQAFAMKIVQPCCCDNGCSRQCGP